jgi:hypothetical protein
LRNGVPFLAIGFLHFQDVYFLWLLNSSVKRREIEFVVRLWGGISFAPPGHARVTRHCGVAVTRWCVLCCSDHIVVLVISGRRCFPPSGPFSPVSTIRIWPRIIWDVVICGGEGFNPKIWHLPQPLKLKYDSSPDPSSVVSSPESSSLSSM